MLRILCSAKVNLFLAIQGKDSSGYHLLDTVFMRTRLFQDTLTLERADEFSFHCPTLPTEGNTVVKALEVLQAHTGRTFKYRITLDKGVPPGSGLGGASSDAASLLMALNDLEELKLSKQNLLGLGLQVGMDVPFFLSGYSMAHGTHYGEVLEALPPLPPEIQVRIELGQSPASTKEMFARWDSVGQSSTKTSATLIAALKSQDAHAILQNLHNDFQQFYHDLPENAVLTGSGSAYTILKISKSKN